MFNTKLVAQIVYPNWRPAEIEILGHDQKIYFDDYILVNYETDFNAIAQKLKSLGVTHVIDDEDPETELTVEEWLALGED